MILIQMTFLSKLNFMKNTETQHIDYKDIEVLKQYINPHGRILPSRRTDLSAKQQREVSNAIKRARFMGLIPYIQK